MFASKRYINFQRYICGKRFLFNLRNAQDHDKAKLFDIMKQRKGSVVTDADALDKFNTDWTGKYKGHSKYVLMPKDVNEISEILKYCNTEKIGVVPQGGNTSVVGSSVAIGEEIILSLARLNEIESFDESNGIVVCGPGTILQTLQETVCNKYNHLVPIDLGSKGTCMIGGNLSTNAGGQYYYRFGSIHANIIGLEVVLADGTILNLMNLNRKDNTGYDLKHLFIGAEGTLGVITKLALSCPPLPRSKNAAFIACNTYKDVQQTLKYAKEELGEILSAFELLDKAVLDQVISEKEVPLTQNDGTNYAFCLLVETQGSNNSHDQEKMESFLQRCMEDGNVIDGVLAQDIKQQSNMWEIRESCNPIIKSKGYNYKYDISLPIKEYYTIVEEIRDRLSTCDQAVEVVNWGHVIDGNLHLNIITPGKFEVDSDLLHLIEPFIFEFVVERGGSISAEHGLGQCKNDYLGKYAKTPEVLSVMLMLKKSFDPNGILNPGKFLPTNLF